MKKLLNFLMFYLITFYLSSHSYAQHCNTFTLTTQEAIDSFNVNYPDCDSLLFSLNIHGSDIVSLDSLHQVKNLQSLSIASTSITSICGLQNLEQARSISIRYNPNLESIDHFGRLDGYSTLSIIGNNNLIGITNIRLDSLGLFSMEDNIKLTSLEGIEVNYVDLMQIINCKALIQLDFNIASIRSFISQENKISTYSRLSGVIIEELAIYKDSTITNISDMEQDSTINLLTIQQCPNLQYCSSDWLCQLVKDNAFLLTMWIFNNGVGCSSESEILAGCLSSTVGPQADISEMLLFPNPAMSYLQLDIPENINYRYYQIYDIDGRMVSIHNQIQNNQIDIAYLDPGAYILIITDDYNRKTRGRFVKL